MAAVGAFPGGRESAAANLGLDLKQFDNKVYENPGHRPLTDDQVRQLERVAGTSFLPDYVAGLYSGVFVPMPEDTSLDNLDLYQRSLATDIARAGSIRSLPKPWRTAESKSQNSPISLPPTADTSPHGTPK